MGNLFKDIQPAVKKETKRIALLTLAGVLIMWIAFWVFHLLQPEGVPFDYTVILGGLFGGLVAVLNFFLMGLTVQKVAAETNEDTARSQMRVSYRQRLLLQFVWIIVAIAVPCFQFVAGIAPLLFPSLAIKGLALTGKA